MPNTTPSEPNKSAAANESNEVVRLRKENEELRAQLAKSKGEDDRARSPRPGEAPSFGMSEGTRVDLEEHGKTTDPFTGEQLTKDDLKK